MKRKPALFAVGYMESDFVRYAIQDERGAIGRGEVSPKTSEKHWPMQMRS